MWGNLLVETWYEVEDKYGMTLAVLADIHERRIEEVVSLLEKSKSDIILIPGDLVDGAKIEKSSDHRRFIDTAILYLNRLAQIAPTYYSIGNHEKQFTRHEMEELHNSDSVILDDGYVNNAADLCIGGLSSGRNYHDTNASQKPNTYFLSTFEKAFGYKILLSHHPEYYEKYLCDRNIDLIISGHAHGG